MSTFGEFDTPPPPPAFADPIPPHSFPPGPPTPPALHTWTPPSRRRWRWSRPAVVGGLMVICAAGGAGAATLAGAGLSNGSNSNGGSAAAPATGQNPFGAGPASGATAPSAGSGSGSGSSTNVTAAVARVEQATVIITSTLAANEGVAEGTGMIISSNGEVLTNNHVIAGSVSVTVQVDGTGTTYQAKVVGDDPWADVALVQIEGASNLPTIPVGNASSVNAGESVIAVGNALGRGALVPVQGSVTALNQTITASEDGSGYGAETLTGLLETNAPIQQGDSGGPVIDSSTGKVIAMDTAADTSSQPFGGTQQGASAAYAISINSALTIAHEIASGGGGNQDIEIGGGALLGVEVSSQASTAQVIGVSSGGPAANAGIVAGDVITSVGGTTITTPASLHEAMLHHRAGQTVQISWTDADGSSHSATVTLASGPPA